MVQRGAGHDVAEIDLRMVAHQRGIAGTAAGLNHE